MPRTKAYPVTWFFILLFLLSGIGFLGIISPFFKIVAMAIVMTILFRPLYTYLCEKRKFPKVAASFITCLGIILLVFIPTIVIISLMTQEAHLLYQKVQQWLGTDQVQAFLHGGPTVLDRLNEFLTRWNMSVTSDDLNKIVSTFVQKFGPFLYEQTQAIVVGIGTFVISFGIMLIVTFYLLMDNDRFKTFLHDLSLLPKDQDQQVMKGFSQMVRGIFLGSGSAAVIDGALSGLAFWFFGISSPVMWGVIMCIFAFLPVLGVGTIMVPVIIYMAVTQQWFIAIGLTCVYLVIAIGVDNLLMPRLIGRYSQIHPLVIFLSVLGGISIFGILGVVFGPLIAAVFLTFADIYQKNYKNDMVYIPNND